MTQTKILAVTEDGPTKEVTDVTQLCARIAVVAMRDKLDTDAEIKRLRQDLEKALGDNRHLQTKLDEERTKNVILERKYEDGKVEFARRIKLEEDLANIRSEKDSLETHRNILRALEDNDGSVRFRFDGVMRTVPCHRILHRASNRNHTGDNPLFCNPDCCCYDCFAEREDEERKRSRRAPASTRRGLRPKQQKK